MPDRPLFYAGQQALSADVLRIAQSGMIGHSMLALLLAGTATVAAGLDCTPTSPASMVVNIAPGLIIQSSEVDATAYGTLGTNTASIQKLGTILTSTAFTLTAPTTSGQSINYLIEGSMQETDTGSTVLNYVNAADPSVPFTGPDNDGTAQNTIRRATVGLQLLAGAAATTGTQTTPATTSGWSPLYVITVNYGQTTVTASSIVTASGAPFVGGGSVSAGRLISVQTFTASGTYAPTSGTNTIFVEVLGGGGGGGGAPATSSTETAAAAGGGSGGYTSGWLTSGFSSVAVTVGAGGTGASGTTTGNAGGNSSFGALLAVNGGQGGGGGAASSTIIAGGAGGAVTAAGSQDSIAGDAGWFSQNNSTVPLLFTGSGGDSQYGWGGRGIGGTGTGAAGKGHGAGGSGAGAATSASAQTGGAGAGGLVRIHEYS